MNPPQIIDDLRLLEPSKPFHLSPWLVLLALTVAAAVWWYRRWLRTSREAREHAHAIHSAHDDALAELAKLFALIDREESRPYAMESSAIIRRYIERRFEMSAPRRSTEEFLVEAQSSPKLTSAQQSALGEFLRVCDLLKFARTLANRDELKELHEVAVHFVKETRPVTELIPAPPTTSVPA